MRKILLAPLCALVTVTVAACSPSGPEQANPELAPRGTTMTKVKPTKQDLTTKLSISGKVEMNPTFGLVAPVDGQVRFFDVPAPNGTPTKPIRVANVWKDGAPNYVEIPAGATFGGRLVDDTSGSIFLLPTDSPDRNYGNVTAGLTADFRNGWSGHVLYQGLVGYKDLNLNMFEIGARLQF